jgi:hypothetical protein
MVLHLHGEGFAGGIEARPFGHCPTDKDASNFQAEIVVEVRGIMALHAEEAAASFRLGFDPAGSGLGGFVEVAFARIVCEASVPGRHDAIVSKWAEELEGSPAGFEPDSKK